MARMEGYLNMELVIALAAVVILTIALGMQIEKNIECNFENDELKQSNNTMAQIIREANIQDVAPKKIKD